MHIQGRQDCGVTLIPKVERQRSRNQLHPSMLRYVEWLSTNWAEYFAEERPQPTSSLSWTRSSSFMTSSSWTSDWHQHEWKDCAWSEKWQDEASSTQVSRSLFWHLETRCTDSNTKSKVVDIITWPTFFGVTDFTNWEAIVVDLQLSFFWISRPDSGNCPARDGQCWQYNWPDARTRTFFFFAGHIALMRTLHGWSV